MHKWKYLSNQHGITLLEILLSIVLLFIILTTFMGFFTQSALFQKNNEDKLAVSNASQKVVSLIEMNASIASLEATIMIPAFEVSEPSTTRKLYRLSNTNPSHKSVLSTLIGSEIDSPYNISLEFEKFEKEGISFIQVTVTVIHPTKIKTESVTYTFIKD
jgi:type II secretory pathway pseudopilin PulG